MKLKKPQISRTLSTLMEDDATEMPGPHAVLWWWRAPKSLLWWWRALKSSFTLLFNRSTCCAVMMTRSQVSTVMMTRSQVLLHAALQQVHMLCCDDDALPSLYCDDDALSSPPSRCSSTGPHAVLWWWRAPKSLLWWWHALKSSFTLLFNRSTCCAVMMTRSQVSTVMMTRSQVLLHAALQPVHMLCCDDDALPSLYCDDDALSSPPSRCSSTGPHAVLWWWRAPKSLLWWWRALKSSFTLLFNRSTCCAVMMTRSQVSTVMMTRSQVLLHAALQQVHMLCCDDDALPSLYCDDDALSSPPSCCSSTGPHAVLWWWRAPKSLLWWWRALKSSFTLLFNRFYSMLMEELNWRFLPGLAPTSCSCPPPRTSESRRNRPPAPGKQPLTPHHSRGPPPLHHGSLDHSTQRIDDHVTEGRTQLTVDPCTAPFQSASRLCSGAPIRKSGRATNASKWPAWSLFIHVQPSENKSCTLILCLSWRVWSSSPCRQNLSNSSDVLKFISGQNLVTAGSGKWSGNNSRLMYIF